LPNRKDGNAVVRCTRKYLDAARAAVIERWNADPPSQLYSFPWTEDSARERVRWVLRAERNGIANLMINVKAPNLDGLVASQNLRDRAAEGDAPARLVVDFALHLLQLACEDRLRLVDAPTDQEIEDEADRHVRDSLRMFGE